MMNRTQLSQLFGVGRGLLTPPLARGMLSRRGQETPPYNFANA